MVSVLQSLPVINMDNLQPGTESWVVTSHKVRRTLEEYGCFMAVYKESSQEPKNEAFDGLKTLFDLPKETKIKNTTPKPLHGYVGPSYTSPLTETLGIQHATSLHAVQSFTNLMWPQGNDHFSNVMHSYANLVSELENLVRKMVFESYGVEKYYESQNESMTYLLKLKKYRPAKPNETNLGFASHTDKGFVTVLGQNQVNGLEVEIKDNEWVTVDFLPTLFFVNVADAFMAWSNGRLRPPRHRVVMNGQEDRYSIALFTFKKGIIEVPQELVDEEHPPRFKPFDHFKFLDFYVKDKTYMDTHAIDMFCGI